jgi:hypothetical protein
MMTLEDYYREILHPFLLDYIERNREKWLREWQEVCPLWFWCEYDV